MNGLGPIMAGGAFFVLTGAFNAYAPVTATMQMENIVRDGPVIEGRVSGRKIKDCAVVKDSFVGWQKVAGVWYETDFSFVEDKTPNSTRPDGWGVQDFGIWRWSGVLPDSVAVKMTLQHNCGGSLTVTQAAFDIDAKPVSPNS